MNLHGPRMPVAILSAVLLLLSAGSGYTDVHSSGAATQPTQIQKYLKVTQPGIFIPLRDIKRTYLTGARLPLFQETFDDYIVKVETVEEGPRLCAFPKRNREGVGTAWVTDEKWLIFGRATTSCPGRFYLFRGEILPIVDETPNAYYVRITRYKRSIILPLPKNMEGLVLFHRKARPTPSLSTTATTSGISRVAAAPAPAAKKQPHPQAVRIVHHRIIEASPPGAGAGAPTEETGRRNLVIIEESEDIQPPPSQPSYHPSSATRQEEPVPDEITRLVKVVPPSPQPSPPAGVASSTKKTHPRPAAEVPSTTIIPCSVATNPPAFPPSPKAAPSPQSQKEEKAHPNEPQAAAPEKAASTETNAVAAAAPPPPTPPVATTAPATSPPPAAPHAVPQEAATSPPSPPAGHSGMGLALKIILVVLIIEGFLIVRLQRQTARLQAPSQQVESFSSIGESVTSDYFQNLAREGGDFSGTLRDFSLNELLEFLHSAEETGVLMIRNSEGSILGQVFFRKGEIVDAFYADQRAKEALLAMIRADNDSFTFNRREVAAKRRTIRQKTMGLLMEVAKNLDENAP